MHFKTFMAANIFLLAGAGCALPQKTLIEVPYTTQAPGGDWAEPWQNACEETSMAMVSAFYAEESLSAEKAAEEIRKILEFKNKNIGPGPDESLETISRLVSEMDLRWKARVVAEPAIEALKEELRAGRPIIVPVYAPALQSPFYEVSNSDYHVMVLVGYDDEKEEFIVNDPGTSSGAQARYSYEILMGAIHDLSTPDYLAGKKAVLFTAPAPL